MTDTKQFRKLHAASSEETSVLWVDAPATAASTEEMLNDTDTAKWVRLNAGTVTAVKVGLPGSPVTVAGAAWTTTGGDWFRVRPGHVLSITYSVVPTSVQWFEE